MLAMSSTQSSHLLLEESKDKIKVGATVLFLSQSTFAHQSLTERLAQVAERTQPLEPEKVQMSHEHHNWENCIF